MRWRKTSDEQPQKPGISAYEYVPCIVWMDGEIKLLQWNCQHLCWDDEFGDDHFAEAIDVDYWMPLSELPEVPK